MNILVAPGMLPAHLLPYLEPARLLRRRGHRVYIYAERYAARLVAPTGCRFVESAAPRATEVFLRERAVDRQTRAATRFTYAVGRDLRRRLARLRIDAALVDQMNAGAALALSAAGVRWASLAISPQILSPHIDDWPSRIPTDALRRELGLAPAALDSLVQGISPHRFLLPWVTGLDLFAAPPRSQHVGNVYAAHGRAPELRRWLGRRGRAPRVLVSLSTAPDLALRASLTAFIDRLLAALARLDVRAVVTLGNIGKVRLPTSPADHVRIERFVDHSAILDCIDVAVNQGGWGTISRTLAAGVPMLLVPFERDQFGNAGLCQAAGLGIASLAPDLSIDVLADTLRYLATPDNPFARRARAQVALWRSAGGARRVAGLVTELARA